MAHVHYKFSSKLKYESMVFDGLNITLKDLKRQIMDREKLRAADCDLQITNAQTKEEYKDDEDLIAKNSSIIVRRIPKVGVKSSGSKTTSKTMSKTTDRSDNQFHHQAFGSTKAMDNQSFSRSLTLLSQTCNLANANASEEDKIQAMMSQSTHEYDPMNYVKKHGPPPPNYTCFRCGMNGHHIRNCPTNGDKTFESLPKIKKSTGIPRSFMVEVDDPNIKGAMLTHCGRYAIPTIDAEAYAKGKKERPPFAPPLPPAAGAGGEEKKEEEEAVPTELLCLICREMLHDAVLIPCCGNSYCDDCIRSALLESDEHVCPTCAKVDVSPDTLVANKFLRQAVNSFNNELGNQNSLATPGPSAPTSQTSNPSPSPAPNPPPPVSATQTRPKTPYQQTRHQQDPLMSRPPPAHTPPLAQPNTPSPVATAPSSASSTPVNSPPRPQNQPDVPGSTEAEAEVSVDAAEASIPSGSSSPVEAPPLMAPGYHVPVAEDRESISPKNTQMSPTYPTVRPSDQPPVKESSSTSSGPAVGGGWPYPREGPGPPLPPPPLIPKEEMYRHQQRRMKERPTPWKWFKPPAVVSSPSRSSSGRGPNRDGRGQQRPKAAADELGGDFAKELLEYRRMQRQRRRSYSRSPQRSSSVSQMSSDSYSPSRSYSRSPSRSPGPAHSRGRSRCRSRSRSRPRHRRSSARRHGDRSHHHGYKRSRSPTPPSSSPSRRRRSSRTRSRSRSRSRGSRRKASRCRHHRHSAGSHHDHHGDPGRRGSPACDRHPYHAGCDAQRFRQWETEYLQWYDKYFGNYTGTPHHLQPPPLLPTPRPACGRPAPNRRRPSPSGPCCSSQHARPQPGRLPAKRSRSPPRRSPDGSRSPGSDEDSGSLTYQQRCSEMFGHQASYRDEAEDREPAPPRTPASRGPDDPTHKKKKRRRSERERADGGEAEEAPPLGASFSSSSGRGRWDGGSNRDSPGTPLHNLGVCSRAEPGDEAWDRPYAGTLRADGGREGQRGDGGREGQRHPGDEGVSTEPSRAPEPGRPKHGEPRPDHSRSERKKRRAEERSSESLRKDVPLDGRHLDSSHRSENAKSGQDGDDPRHGGKPNAVEKEAPPRGSPTEYPLWEGVTKVRNPQRKSISININLTQLEEVQKVAESHPTAGSSVEEERMDAGDENEDTPTVEDGEEVVDDNRGVKLLTTVRRAAEEPVGGGEAMKTMEKKRSRRADGGKVLEEVEEEKEEEEKEESRAGARKRRGEEPGEVGGERTKAPGRRSQSTSASGETPIHARRDRSEGRQDRKRKTLENHSSQDGFLHPEDTTAPVKVRSRWAPLEAGAKGPPAGKEEPASGEARLHDASAALGPVPVSAPTKRTAARDGLAPEDGARAPRGREAEGGRERETGRGRDQRRRTTESERASGGTEKRGPHSSSSSSSSRTAGDARGREPEDGAAAAAGPGPSQPSSRSSSSSSSSFSQPDGVPRPPAAAAGVSGADGGGGRRGRRDPDATVSCRDRKAPEARRDAPSATPRDGEAGEQQQRPHHRRHRHHHSPQHRRHRDDHHEHQPVREQRDPRSPAEGPPGGPERRDPRPPSSQGPGADPPGAGAARGPPDKPRLDVFSGGRNALLRPRKPIDIKIISGASLFQQSRV
ncbi:E3 ubiquitin-protein ligase RBBP6-like [Gadus chalcogrammus]|uniref:E3 ubiquitin-protein ligase RBBP6-like n=1 Tax=Gadus chalcogrammus TaxID=1042646 RepID=UPI0024C2C783|nr:E3 ubiquitin-protein ligase RBBP6-like [Gadus chalcogrammus]